jgi:hypothetical protein
MAAGVGGASDRAGLAVGLGLGVVEGSGVGVGEGALVAGVGETGEPGEAMGIAEAHATTKLIHNTEPTIAGRVIVDVTRCWRPTSRAAGKLRGCR